MGGASIRHTHPTITESVLHALIDPNFAFLFFIVGIVGIVSVIIHPGVHILGVVGLVLLLAGLVPLFAALVRRMRERPRSGAAIAVGACAIGWAVHAGLDWDWQMPAVSLWLFALGGTALAAPAADARQRTRKPLGVLPRAALGIAFLCVAGLPALAAVSQSELDDALSAYDRGDCASAVDDAQSARAFFQRDRQDSHSFGAVEQRNPGGPAGRPVRLRLNLNLLKGASGQCRID